HHFSSARPQQKNITKVTLRDALRAASLGVAHVVLRGTPRAMSYVVGTGGFEPPTSCASDRRSPTELRPWPGAKNSVPTGPFGCQAPCLSPAESTSYGRWHRRDGGGDRVSGQREHGVR